ncbi:MAG: hypothetical protein WCA61_08550 [Nitrososphaeraceae archaeon]
MQPKIFLIKGTKQNSKCQRHRHFVVDESIGKRIKDILSIIEELLVV